MLCLENEESSLVIQTSEVNPNEVSSSSGYSTSSTGDHQQLESSTSAGEVFEVSGVSENPENKTRPNASYVAMISQAILTSPEEELTLSDIYQWIENNYTFFKNKTDGKWKNSVRHALSLHDCFIKHWRPNHAKGHFWAINPIYKANFLKGDYRKLKKMRCISPAVSLHELYMTGAYYDFLPREQEQNPASQQSTSTPFNCLQGSTIGYPSFYQIGLPLSTSQNGDAIQVSSTPIASSPLALWQSTSTQVTSSYTPHQTLADSFGGCHVTPAQVVPCPPVQPMPETSINMRNYLYERLEGIHDNANFFQIKE